MANQTVGRRRLAGCVGATVPVVFGVIAVAAPGEGRADDILVYQQQLGFGADTAGAEAETLLESLGHTVTLVSSLTPVLPDLAQFDTIYFTQASMTANESNAALAALAAGKGIYVTAESSPGYDGFVNGVVQNFVAQALTQNDVQIGSALNPEAAQSFNGAAAGGITTTPNALGSFTTIDPGPVGPTVAMKNTLTSDSMGIKGGAVFPPEELDGMSGCLVVVADLDWWTPATGVSANARRDIAENFQTFLNGCADGDDDGVSDQQETASGTNPSDADSDNDGLCDGYGTGNGTCIPGDGIYEDADMDGMIDPLDDDDDNDGVPTSYEAPLEVAYPDVDGDGVPTWEDEDSDGDGYPDSIEQDNDYDMNGVPAIVEIGDVPMGCQDDGDCGAANSGVVCDDTLMVCVEGCRGEGGNGCPSGETCTSTDGSIGECVPDGSGGGGGGPSGGTTGAGTTTGAGATSSSSGAGGGGDAEEGEDDGCGCRSSGAPSGSGAALALLGLAVLLSRRASLREKK